MRTRDLLKGPRGSIEGGAGVPGGQGGHLGDPLGQLDGFDESSDDSSDDACNYISDPNCSYGQTYVRNTDGQRCSMRPSLTYIDPY